MELNWHGGQHDTWSNSIVLPVAFSSTPLVPICRGEGSFAFHFISFEMDRFPCPGGHHHATFYTLFAVGFSTIQPKRQRSHGGPAVGALFHLFLYVWVFCFLLILRLSIQHIFLSNLCLGHSWCNFNHFHCWWFKFLTFLLKSIDPCNQFVVIFFFCCL
jgi:hypothetical protein